jgi:hypothetical protein
MRLSILALLIAPLLLAPAFPQRADRVDPKPAEKKKLRVVVFGAHPDDPESGCGGLMALLRKDGHEVIAGYATCFRGDRKIDKEPEADVRRREATAACKILGATPHFFDYAHEKLIADEATLEAVSSSSRRGRTLAKRVPTPGCAGRPMNAITDPFCLKWVHFRARHGLGFAYFRCAAAPRRRGTATRCGAGHRQTKNVSRTSKIPLASAPKSGDNGAKCQYEAIETPMVVGGAVWFTGNSCRVPRLPVFANKVRLPPQSPQHKLLIVRRPREWHQRRYSNAIEQARAPQPRPVGDVRVGPSARRIGGGTQPPPGRVRGVPHEG